MGAAEQFHTVLGEVLAVPKRKLFMQPLPNTSTEGHLHGEAGGISDMGL